MKKRVKIVVFSICLLLIFSVLLYFTQLMLTPIFPAESTGMVVGYKLLEENSLDVVFLGASQTFTGIDAGRLTREFGIESFDLCSSGQIMSMMPLYFDYALKTQTPKIVMVEVYSIFDDPTGCYDSSLAWNYGPMPASKEKYQSLLKVFGGDKWKAFEYCYLPYLVYHSRWSSFYPSLFYKYYINPKDSVDISNRGFYGRDHVEQVTIQYYENDEITQRIIPESNQDDMLYMKKVCDQKGIQLVFYKSPSADWSRSDSISTKSFMKDNGLTFIDLNDYIDEIGIDASTDFHSVNHLNVSGAEKTTEYLASILNRYMHN